MLCLENHWGLTTKVENVLAIHKAVNSPWLGVNVDTGNYPGDPYDSLAKLASVATIVQAKTYYGGGVWYSLDLDYPRIAKILRGAGIQRLGLTRNGRQRIGPHGRAQELRRAPQGLRLVDLNRL